MKLAKRAGRFNSVPYESSIEDPGSDPSEIRDKGSGRRERWHRGLEWVNIFRTARSPPDPLTGFTIASPDRNYLPAETKIIVDAVEVSAAGFDLCRNRLIVPS